MCAGPDILLASQIFGGVATGLSAIKGLTGGDKGPAASTMPDASAAAAQAEQDAAKAALDRRRRVRANSLLSSYGGAGDPTEATTRAGKATLGA